MKYFQFIVPTLIIAFAYCQSWASMSMSCTAVFDAKPAIALTGRLVQLGGTGESAQQYNASVDSLRPGDRFSFAENSTFTFERMLGQGQTTYVIKTAEGLVLRVPKSTWGTKYGGKMLHTFLQSYVTLHKELKDAGVDVPKLDLARSRPPHFLVVEELPIQFTLDQFLGFRDQAKIKGLSKDQRKTVADKFFEFALKTWRFEVMSNFSGRQIGWTGTKWVMFDIEHMNQKIKTIDSEETAFDTLEFEGDYGREIEHILPKRLFDQIRARIVEIRKAQATGRTWLDRKHSSFFNKGEHEMFRTAMALDEIPGMIVVLSDSGRGNQTKTWTHFKNAEGLPQPGNVEQMFQFKKLLRVTEKQTILFTVLNLKTQQEQVLELQLALLDDFRYGSVMRNDRDFRQALYGNDFTVYEPIQ